MKDRQVPNVRPIITGITREEYHQGRRADFGTTWDQIRKDIPRDPGLALEGSGIPMNMPAFTGTPPRRACLGVTKAGTDCKANPVAARDFCQGHIKQVEAALNDES